MTNTELVARVLSALPDDDDHPYRTGAWTPQRNEWNAPELELLAGEIPADLDGIYLRNTENPALPSIGRYHPFDGDAMVHLVGFRDGKAFYRNRFVRTDGLLAEQEAGRPLWAGLSERPTKAIREDGWGARGRMKDSSSTDVVVHAGVAITSFYQCGDLYRLDPLTLDDLGKSTWHGQFPSALGVSAHPKVDDRTGEMLFFNYSTEWPYMHYGVVDAENRLVHYVDIELPGPRLPHDMAYTDNYAILNDLPLFWDPELLQKNAFVPRLHRDIPTRLGVIPRRGQSNEIRWFEFEPTYVLHWSNAYEVGDEVVVEGYFQDCPEPQVAPDATYYQRLSRFLSLDGMQTKLHRWRMNMRTGATSEERLSDTLSEFPMINGQFAGRQHRYTYSTTGVPGFFLFDGLLRHDGDTGKEEHYSFGEGVFGSETAVAPRVGATAEDDGYLITLTTDVDNDRSECLVFDAANVTLGPIARLLLPERISSGTHSTWAAGDSLPNWR
ncbi:carotenoid oxygenase family protein [Antrihabitans sp. YC2-6]|uniref:carotenoid oxygenase family protein n=1 Tax=Antrihabitans sp. YC2-6 TaxID=2799498 RepID=UPI0018F6B482|nr:carotenoid oxygenase family protein [Antrihabitans sp. YC2-6]MBJ8346007.1 carotenoid oxygenase family protein [Antrihabitans sp. YC2-6]